MDEEESNIMEEAEASAAEEDSAAAAQDSVPGEKRDEKREKIIKRVKEVLAQSPNKAKNPTVIVICYRGKKKRNPDQSDRNEETSDNSDSPNNSL